MGGKNRYWILRDLWRELRLAWALLKDPRVPTWTKVALPGLWLVYFLFPLDLIVDFIPIVGEIDDLVLLLILLRAFVALSPPDVVRDVEARLQGRQATGRSDIIEGQYRVIDE